MLKTKSFLYTILLVLSLSIGYSTKTMAKNNISGGIKSLPKGSIHLIGKVIAKNLHGNDLKAAVEKLFSKEKFSPKTTSLK